MLSEKIIDAIVSDNEMEGMNGIELLKYLIAKEDTTPFIIFTREAA
jgi:DNA-binding NtrC family response regulator